MTPLETLIQITKLILGLVALYLIYGIYLKI
jgi:hypothetical protein